MNGAAKSSKLALLGAFILQPAHWDAQAEEWSRRLPHDWPGEHGQRLGEFVQAGKAQMLEFRRDGQRIGFVVYEIDHDFAAPEMVILAAYSGPARIDVTESCLPELAEFAAREKCGTIRFHTMRPGLIEKAQRAGYRVSEVIMRCDVKANT